MAMASKPSDRRVLRSRDLVLETFRVLMIERGYEKMTVQHILDRSRVGRATFYAHFKGKEDLLSSSMQRLQMGLRNAWSEEVRQALPAVRPLGFSLAFLRHIDSHRRIYDLIVGKPSEATIDRHVRQMLAKLTREDLLTQSAIRRNAPELEVAVQFVSASLWSLTVWWVSTQSKLSAEELDEQFRHLVLQGLEKTLDFKSRHR
jgi:AcrR family transcriptional regulator